MSYINVISHWISRHTLHNSGHITQTSEAVLNHDLSTHNVCHNIIIILQTESIYNQIVDKTTDGDTRARERRSFVISRFGSSAAIHRSE